jgi:ABC-type amino acid transport substrate-binding protein
MSAPGYGAVEPTDFDSGRIWVAFKATAVLLAFVSAGMAAGCFLSPNNTAIQTKDVPDGRPYHVIEGLDGQDVTIIDCPSSFDWLNGADDPLCNETARALSVAGVISTALAGLFTLMFAVAADG